MKKSTGIVVMAALVIVLGAGSALYFTSNDYQIKRYLKLAEQCYEKGAYGETLEYCAAALELDDTLTEVYCLYSDSCLSQGQYEEAVQALKDGLEATGEEELSGRLAEVYRQYSDVCLSQGQYEKAVQALMDGVDTTGAAELSEREAYLREHIVVAKKSSYMEGYGLQW